MTEYVLIIGSGDFPLDVTIRQIPNITVNVNKLRELFSGDIIPIPHNNITFSLNEIRNIILEKLDTICNIAQQDDTLIVYYSGHGIMSRINYQLYLTAVDSTTKGLQYNAINIADFKYPIENCPAQRKIVILDCCHSGHFAAMDAGIVEAANEQTIFNGTYVLTSASADEPALFPADYPELPTYFTGELIKIIQNGVAVQKEFCSLGDVYPLLRKTLTSQNCPAPRQVNFDAGANIPFFRNTQYNHHENEEWQSINQEDFSNIDNLKGFLQNYPNSIHVKEVRRNLERLVELFLWEAAQRKDSLTSYSYYLDNTKLKTHKKEAQRRIMELNEERWWPKIKAFIKDIFQRFSISTKNKRRLFIILGIVILCLTGVAFTLRGLWIDLYYLECGIYNFGIKQYQKAKEYHSMAIEINPKYAFAYYNRGLAERQLEEYKGAVDDYTKAIEINPKYADAYYKRGIAKKDLNDFKGAIDDYTKAIEIDPKDTTAYYNRERAKESLKEFKGEIRK